MHVDFQCMLKVYEFCVTQAWREFNKCNCILMLLNFFCSVDFQCMLKVYDFCVIHAKKYFDNISIDEYICGFVTVPLWLYDILIVWYVDCMATDSLLTMSYVFFETHQGEYRSILGERDWFLLFSWEFSEISDVDDCSIVTNDSYVIITLVPDCRHSRLGFTLWACPVRMLARTENYLRRRRAAFVLHAILSAIGGYSRWETRRLRLQS